MRMDARRALPVHAFTNRPRREAGPDRGALIGPEERWLRSPIAHGWAAAVAGLALLAGAGFERFAGLRAGQASARRDPEYTVVPPARERLEAGRGSVMRVRNRQVFSFSPALNANTTGRIARRNLKNLRFSTRSRRRCGSFDDRRGVDRRRARVPRCGPSRRRDGWRSRRRRQRRVRGAPAVTRRRPGTSARRAAGRWLPAASTSASLENRRRPASRRRSTPAARAILGPQRLQRLRLPDHGASTRRGHSRCRCLSQMPFSVRLAEQARQPDTLDVAAPPSTRGIPPRWRRGDSCRPVLPTAVPARRRDLTGVDGVSQPHGEVVRLRIRGARSARTLAISGWVGRAGPKACRWRA